MALPFSASHYPQKQLQLPPLPIYNTTASPFPKHPSFSQQAGANTASFIRTLQLHGRACNTTNRPKGL